MVNKMVICVGLLLSSLISFAQHFTGEGKVVDLPGIIKNNTTVIALPAATSPASIRYLKKLLYNKINRALDNLEDEDLGLKNGYEFLWGPQTVADIESELMHLKIYLRDTSLGSLPVDHYVFKYLPSIQVFHDMLNDPECYDTTTENRDNDLSINLYHTDPFVKWLVSYYNTAAQELDNKGISMDHVYKQGWRQLENLYRSNDSLKKWYDEKFIINPVFDCTAFQQAKKLNTDINDRVSNNYIFKTVLQCDFYKKLLWFTDGILLTDPFLSSTDDRAYPENEKYLFRDSLYKAFKPRAAAAVFDKLQTGRTLLNKVSFPKTGEEGAPVYMMNYDAANRYNYAGVSVPKVLPDDQKYVIAVNNVARNNAVKIEFTKDPIPDQSGFMLGLNRVLDDAGAAALGIAGYSTGLGPFLSSLAKHPVNNGGAVKNNVPSLDTAIYDPRRDVVGDNAGRAIHNSRKNKISITVNKIKYDLTGTDKDRELIVSTYSIQKKYCDKDDLVENFLKSDLNTAPLSYTNEKQISALIRSLTATFDEFIPGYRNIQKRNWVDSISNTHNKLFRLITLFNRSLPPSSIEIKTDNNPLYRTVISNVPLDGGNKTTYNIIEKTGTDKDSVITYSTSGSVRSGKKSVLQVSLGIAGTLTSYKRQIAASSNNQLTYSNDNDQVRAVAGLHIYPRKLFMLNNKLFGGNNRSKNGSDFRNNFSFFIGLGIPKPLENYYAGLSMDIVPGLRIIGGAHFYKYISYVIQNNSIASQKNKVGVAGPFIALTFDAATFGKIVGIFKN